MSLGLPGHLAAHSESKAFARSAHVIALVCLLAAFGILLSAQLAWPESELRPAMLALAPIVVCIVLLERHRSIIAAGIYLAVGTASVYMFVVLCATPFAATISTDAYLLLLPKIALLMVSSPSSGVLSRALWAIAGAALAEGATMLAAMRVGIAPTPDVTLAAILAAVVALLVVIGLSRRRVRFAQPGLHRAERDELLSRLREQFEEQAAAMVHDTVLNHLAAIANAPDGPLKPEVASRIERDVAQIVGGEWLFSSGSAAPDADDGRQTSGFLRALDEARELGLVVQLGGDRTAAARLDQLRGNALGLAVKQCLVNVMTHAGTDRAEVVIYGSDDEVTVMIVDDGRGFAELDTGPDRLGLRQSVRRRIEAVGGAVQVWSSPGTGTSILIRMPAATATATKTKTGVAP
jgi:hypothetical protein